MEIRDIMTRNPQWIAPETTIQEAAQQMQQQNIGALLVAANDRITGVVTDRDIAVRSASQGLNPQNTAVDEIKSNQALYCFDDQTAEWAANNMNQNNITRLIVVNRDKRLQGVLSHGDIARAVESKNLQANELGLQVTKVAAQQCSTQASNSQAA